MAIWSKFLPQKPQQNKKGPKVTTPWADPLEKIGEKLTKNVVGSVVGDALKPGVWMGNLSNLSKEDLAKKQQEESAKKEQEMAKLRGQIKGRNVEAEIKEVREKKTQEEQKEQEFLQQVALKREQEKKEQEAQAQNQEAATPRGKQKKKRGSALASGKQAKPSEEQLSATREFSGKPE